MNGNVLFEIKDLQKKFGSLTVFDGLSETICKGDVVVIIGPSGSGKSTFIRCLAAHRRQNLLRGREHHGQGL